MASAVGYQTTVTIIAETNLLTDRENNQPKTEAILEFIKSKFWTGMTIGTGSLIIAVVESTAGSSQQHNPSCSTAWWYGATEGVATAYGIGLIALGIFSVIARKCKNQETPAPTADSPV